MTFFKGKTTKQNVQKAVLFLSQAIIYRVVEVPTREFVRDGDNYVEREVFKGKRYRQVSDRQSWGYEQGIEFIKEVVRYSSGSTTSSSDTGTEN